MSFVTITIDPADVSADITDFPLVITERDLPALFWATATTANIQCNIEGGANIDTEVAWVDTGNERARVHCKIPTVSSSAETKIEMHWDVTPDAPTAVFTAYTSVLPLKALTLAEIGTFGTDNITPVVGGSPVYDNGGMQFDSSNTEHITLSSITTRKDHYTVACCKLDTVAKMTSVCTYANTVSRVNAEINGGNSVGMWGNANSRLSTSPTVDPGTTNFFVHTYWMQEAATAGSDLREVWYNGGSKGTDTTVSAQANLTNIRVGQEFSNTEKWNGKIQEVRCGLSRPTDQWVEYEHLNLLNVDDYVVAFAAPVAGGAGRGARALMI